SASKVRENMQSRPGSNGCWQERHDLRQGGVASPGFAGHAMVLSSGYVRCFRQSDERIMALPAPDAGMPFVHVVCGYKPGQRGRLAIYVNGQYNGDSMTHEDVVASSMSFTVGVSGWTRYGGVVDEMAVYDHVLDATRILDHIAKAQ